MDLGVNAAPIEAAAEGEAEEDTEVKAVEDHKMDGHQAPLQPSKQRRGTTDEEEEADPRREAARRTKEAAFL